MDGKRRCELHPPQEETPPDEQGMVDVTSFRDKVMTLSGNQAAEAQLHKADNTWAFPEYHDDCASISSGSFSPDLGRHVQVWVPKARTGTAGLRVIVILRQVPKKRRG